MSQTLGEKRVRVRFNVAEGETRSTVDEIKASFAKLIDQCDAMREKDHRLAAESMTRIEDAAHWMVKLATANT